MPLIEEGLSEIEIIRYLMYPQPKDIGKTLASATVAGSRTREMVRARTNELALIAGRRSHEIKQVDYERAKREVTGESDFDRQEAVLGSQAQTSYS